ncbi:carbohydrate ABC transporter permease [Pseudonocardia sp. TRM90224]|uniref:carbohydrate ABC transporter permease n=1 Tax=Pseudonocardia sp. TRM90224 TaxID=2812678 RepID=UPI001E3EFD9B|nr:sugar ABC transporter permease [Pseudonocardia sp. TRM90224]
MIAAPPASAQPPPAPAPRRAGRGRELAWLGFTLPALVWFLVFTVGPLVSLFYFAQTNWRGLLSPRTFVGGQNFARLLDDPVFHHAILNSLVQLVVSLPIVIAGAFMIAYYLALRPRGHRFVRAVLFTPVLLSAPALAMIFVGVFSPSGLVNSTLESAGLGELATPWLAVESTAATAIMIVIIWSSMSVSAVLLASRLNTVPSELFEAAELDGCGHWRRMWLIAWPACRESVGVVTTLQFLWTLFSSAAIVLLLTRGGPGTATVNLSFLVYDYAFNQSKVGYSQAIAVMLFVVGVLGLVGIRRLFRQRY